LATLQLGHSAAEKSMWNSKEELNMGNEESWKLHTCFSADYWMMMIMTMIIFISQDECDFL